MYSIPVHDDSSYLANPHSDRTKRVRDARSEAQKEIEEYKKQRDEEFKKFEQEVGQPPNV